MRKLVSSFFISLDGVVESPDKWHFPYFNDEMGQAVGSAIAETDTMLLGRRLYEEWAAYWPQQDPASDPFVSIMNETPKVVVSTTLERVDWQSSTLLEGDLAEGVKALKARPGKNIGMSGSATLVRSLLELGLLDELRLLVHPSSSATAQHSSRTARVPCHSSWSTRARSQPVCSTSPTGRRRERAPDGARERRDVDRLRDQRRRRTGADPCRRRVQLPRLEGMAGAERAARAAVSRRQL